MNIDTLIKWLKSEEKVGKKTLVANISAEFQRPQTICFLLSRRRDFLFSLLFWIHQNLKFTVRRSPLLPREIRSVIPAKPAVPDMWDPQKPDMPGSAAAPRSHLWWDSAVRRWSQICLSVRWDWRSWRPLSRDIGGCCPGANRLCWRYRQRDYSCQHQQKCLRRPCYLQYCGYTTKLVVYFKGMGKCTLPVRDTAR